MQIYLLSVLSTIAAGATLAADYLADRIPVLEPLRRFAASSRAKATVGAIAAAVGFLLLWWRFPRRQEVADLVDQGIADQVDQLLFPGQVIIFGDFLPAIAGLLLGAMLMVDRYRERHLPGEAAEQVVSADEATEGDTNSEAQDTGATGIAKIDDVLKPYRTPLGLAGIAVGVIHFLLAGVLFL